MQNTFHSLKGAWDLPGRQVRFYHVMHSNNSIRGLGSLVYASNALVLDPSSWTFLTSFDPIPTSNNSIMCRILLHACRISQQEAWLDTSVLSPRSPLLLILSTACLTACLCNVNLRLVDQRIYCLAMIHTTRVALPCVLMISCMIYLQTIIGRKAPLTSRAIYQ